MAIFKNSRFLHVPAYIKDGKTLMFGIREKIKFDPSKAVFYTVVEGDSIDGIAFKFYSSERLHWVILDANPQYKTELDIKVGDTLIIPSFNEVVKAIE